MEYFLVIIAALFFQSYHKEGDRIPTQKTKEDIKYDASLKECSKKFKYDSSSKADECSKRLYIEARERMLKEKRALGKREIIEGCSVIAWVELSEGTFIYPVTPESQIADEIDYGEAIRDPLVKSVFFKDTEAVKCFLETGHDPDANSYILSNSGVSALVFAIFRDSPEIVKLLIEYGANVNEKNEDGETYLLHKAEFFASKEIIEILKAHGAK